MSQQDQSPVGVLRLIGTGGAGTNIIGSWHDMDNGRVSGSARCQVVYADTSRSNLPDGINDSNVFLLDGTDGSGGVRASNHVEIGRNVPGLLQKYPPGDLNVVCFSCAGGSGSVFGPLTIRELIRQGKPVVAIIIGSEESAIRRKNTLNSIKSLDNLARELKTPIVAFYVHNTPDRKRSEVDRECRYVMASLSILASRKNREIDTADLANWLNFPKVTAVEPQLSLLHVYDNPADVDASSEPISIASLRKDADEPTYECVPEYNIAGFPREKIENFKQLYFVITIDGVKKIEKMLNERLTDAQKQAAARVKHDPIVKPGDEVTDDGMVL